MKPNEVKKPTTQAYELHDFMLTMCVGEKNAMKADNLVFMLGLSGTRELRTLRAEVNGPKSQLQHKILTSNEGYYISEAENPQDAHKQYKQVAWRKIKQGAAMIKEGRQLLNMVELDQTTRLKLTEYMQEIVQIYVDEIARKV